jgi:hypothetical protein
MKALMTLASRRDDMKIARRFNAGNRAFDPVSPEGTAESDRSDDGVQSSLRDSSIFLITVPALKRRAIFDCPFGTEAT